MSMDLYYWYTPIAYSMEKFSIQRFYFFSRPSSELASVNVQLYNIVVTMKWNVGSWNVCSLAI